MVLAQQVCALYASDLLRRNSHCELSFKHLSSLYTRTYEFAFQQNVKLNYMKSISDTYSSFEEENLL